MQSRSNIVSRRSFLGMQALMLAASLSACGAVEEDAQKDSDLSGTPRTLDEIRASGYINLGVYSDDRPLSYMNWSGLYGGFDNYICLYIRENTGYELRYVSIDPHERYDILHTNKVDAVIAGMSPSDARANEAVFTDPVYKAQLCIVSPTDATITSTDQLTEGEVIVCKGTYAEQYATDNWPEVKLRTYETFTDMYHALENRKGIALVADEISATTWATGRTRFSVSMRDIGEPRNIALAVAEGQEDLAMRLSRATNKFVSSGIAEVAYEEFLEGRADDPYDVFTDVERTVEEG